MSAIAAFLLAIACINFVNLSTARALGRAQEVGIRKTVGAQRRQLIGQFFAESTLMVLIAAVTSLCLLALSLSNYNAFVGIEFSLTPYENPQILLVFVAVVLGTGVLSGLYPALVLSAFQPAMAAATKFSKSIGPSPPPRYTPTIVGSTPSRPSSPASCQAISAAASANAALRLACL